MNELALFAGAGGGFSVEHYLAGIQSARAQNQNKGKNHRRNHRIWDAIPAECKKDPLK